MLRVDKQLTILDRKLTEKTRTANKGLSAMLVEEYKLIVPIRLSTVVRA